VDSPFFSHLPRWELTAKLKTFFSGEAKREIEKGCAYSKLRKMLPAQYAEWDSFSQAQYLEATGLLPGYILSSQGDRMAMAHSVEGRFPFLDYRVIEFASTIPPSLKMKALNEKHILKRASADLVPVSVRKRSKQPYRAPDIKSFFDTTVGSARHEYVSELLSESNIRRSGLFNPPAVAKLVDKGGRGLALGVKDNMALVGILSTQLFMEQFITIFRRYGECR